MATPANDINTFNQGKLHLSLYNLTWFFPPDMLVTFVVCDLVCKDKVNFSNNDMCVHTNEHHHKLQRIKTILGTSKLHCKHHCHCWKPQITFIVQRIIAGLTTSTLSVPSAIYFRSPCDITTEGLKSSFDDVTNYKITDFGNLILDFPPTHPFLATKSAMKLLH